MAVETSTDSLSSREASPGPNSVKKSRVMFSDEQKEALRIAFQLEPYPNTTAIEFLGRELSLSTRTITNWFHNHRMRCKQENDSNTNREGRSFDPMQFRMLLQRRLVELYKESGSSLSNSFVQMPWGMSYPYCSQLPNEQMSGLDLSMSRIKTEEEEYDAQSFDSSDYHEDSNVSSPSVKDEGILDKDCDEETNPTAKEKSRSNRRKSTAPQWVNPHWQSEEPRKTNEEVIINGVCVMNADNLSVKSNCDEMTVRIDPKPVETESASDSGTEDPIQMSKTDESPTPASPGTLPGLSPSDSPGDP